MEKESSPSAPSGFCEKLLNTFCGNLSSQPIHRISRGSQKPVPATIPNPEPTLPLSPANSDAKILDIQTAASAHEKKGTLKSTQHPDTPEMKKSIVEIPVMSSAPPQAPSLPSTNQNSAVSVLKNQPVPNHVSVEGKSPKSTVEMPPPPKAVRQEQESVVCKAKPRLTGVETEASGKKAGFKNIDDNATDYIKRTKSRIRRTVTGFKRASFKNSDETTYKASDFIKRTKSRIRRTVSGFK